MWGYPWTLGLFVVVSIWFMATEERRRWRKFMAWYDDPQEYQETKDC
jgi:hypothetical protein